MLTVRPRTRQRRMIVAFVCLLLWSLVGNAFGSGCQSPCCRPDPAAATCCGAPTAAGPQHGCCELHGSDFTAALAPESVGVEIPSFALLAPTPAVLLLARAVVPERPRILAAADPSPPDPARAPDLGRAPPAA